MVSWWTSKLACQGGFGTPRPGSTGDLAQNGRISGQESVPGPDALAELDMEEAGSELGLEASDISLTYQVCHIPCCIGHRSKRHGVLWTLALSLTLQLHVLWQGVAADAGVLLDSKPAETSCEAWRAHDAGWP